MTNPRCFMDFSIDDEPVGRVVFELFASRVPKTSENFRSLCTGESTQGLSYKSCPVHRIIPGFMIQSGDITHGNGKGGRSIYNDGNEFKDEDLETPVDEPGLLVMANKGVPDTNKSQFFVTLRDCNHLNGKNVVFGRVLKGYQDVLVDRVANARENQRVVISHCGELVRQATASSTKRRRRSVSVSSAASSTSSTDSEEQEQRRARRHRKRKEEKEKKHQDQEERAEKKQAEPAIDPVEEKRRREQDEARRRDRERELEALKRRYERPPDRRQGDSIQYKGRGVMKAPSVGNSQPSRMRGWN